MAFETVLSILLGIGLAASVGFRIFLPLFALSISAYFNVWELNDNWEWIGSVPALVALGVATLVEIFAYFIPWVDNLLDSVAVPMAAIAGTAVMVSTIADLNPIITWALAIIAGGGTATAIKSTAATGRIASSTTTGGLANPLLGLVETVVAVVMTALAIFVPILASIIVVIILFTYFKLYQKFRSKSKPNEY